MSLKRQGSRNTEASDKSPNEESIPSWCFYQTECDHFQAALQSRIRRCWSGGVSVNMKRKQKHNMTKAAKPPIWTSELNVNSKYLTTLTKFSALIYDLNKNDWLYTFFFYLILSYNLRLFDLLKVFLPLRVSKKIWRSRETKGKIDFFWILDGERPLVVMLHIYLTIPHELPTISPINNIISTKLNWNDYIFFNMSFVLA